MPYGFPSGAGLRKMLCNTSELVDLVRNSDFAGREIEVFSQAFLRSGMASIDAFLAHRGEHQVIQGGATFAQIGKAAIAFALIQCERESQLFNFENQDHWYEYLWQFLGDSLEDIERNQLRIVTFNYDRSLEMYLLSTIQHSFGVDEAVAARYVKKIPIIHVYGKLGEIACLTTDTAGCRNFVSDIDRRSIAVGAAGIKVIGEHRDDGPEFAEAKTAIASAQRICFLGFGFDATNVRRLGVRDVLGDRFRREHYNSPMTYATTLGMKPAERERVIEILSPTEPDSHPGEEVRRENICRIIRNNVIGPQAQQNKNFLRHTGVLHGI